MSPDAGVLVEACVDGVAAALAAERAGAGRLELCAGLVEGGTTPSAGMLAAVLARVAIPVVAMIRPRGGDFLYTSDELEVMERDVAVARSLGAHGVALGVLTEDGAVDGARLAALVRCAQPLPVTVHRAFDLAADPGAALEAAIAAGARRVLTSGGCRTAPEGVATIAALVAQAGGRITVMAGGGVGAAAVRSLVRDAGVHELHVGGQTVVPSAMRFRRPGISLARAPLPDEYSLARADDGRLRDVVAAASLR